MSDHGDPTVHTSGVFRADRLFNRHSDGRGKLSEGLWDQLPPDGRAARITTWSTPPY